MVRILSKNIQETEAMAQKLAAGLQGGELIALVGNLGAGKTFFVKAMAQYWGVKETITSPTFVLLKTYDTRHKKIHKLVHVDCYRLEGEEDLADIGLQDYLNQPDTVVVVEWADKISNLPEKTIKIKIDYIDNEQRQISIEK